MFNMSNHSRLQNTLLYTVSARTKEISKETDATWTHIHTDDEATFKNYKLKNTTLEPKSWANVECSSLCLFDQLLAQVVWACFLSWTVGMHNRFPYSGVKMIGHAQKAAAKTAWGLIKRQHGTLSSWWNKSFMSHLKGAVRLNSTEPFWKPQQNQPAH